MKCVNIERKEVWKNHTEKLDPVCATNTGNAKRAAQKAGKSKALLVLNQAKTSLASRIQCGGGTCQKGWECGKPAIRDVKESDGSLKIEVERVDPPPEPSPCEGRQKPYSARAVIGFTITANCKCEKPAPKDPNFFHMDPLEKVQKKRTKKRATKKPVK